MMTYGRFADSLDMPMSVMTCLLFGNRLQDSVWHVQMFYRLVYITRSR
jgi:hypothetical protein